MCKVMMKNLLVQLYYPLPAYMPFILIGVICSFMNQVARDIAIQRFPRIDFNKAKTDDVKFIFNSQKQLERFLVCPQKKTTSNNWLNGNGTTKPDVNLET